MAHAEEIILNNSLDDFKPGGRIGVFLDRNRAYDIEKILAANRAKLFSPCSDNNFNFGFSDSPIWLHFTVSNPHDQKVDFVLEIAYPVLDQIELYYKSGDKLIMRRAGDMLPFLQREKNYRNFLFSLQAESHSQSDYFIRVESGSSLNIPLRIWSPHILAQKIIIEQFVLGLYFGAIVIMILYNSLLFISLRVITYLHYVLFMSAGALFLFTLCGLSYKYLWPNCIWWANHSLPFFVFACTSFCVSFARSFLETKVNLPKFDPALLAYVVINLALVFVSLLLPYSISIKIATGMALFAAFLPLTAALFLIGRFRQARFYLLAWAVLFFGIIVYGLKTIGVIPSVFLTEYSMMIGLILEVVLLSLGIAAWINSIKEQHLQAQKRELMLQQLAFEQQQQLTCAYERFVPKRFLNLLGKQSILDVELGDHVQKKMSVLFSDIRCFTAISEKMTPKENFRFINSYLKRMEPIIEKHNGVTDKYIGDAIMALFEHADDAVNAALALLDGLQEFNFDRQRIGASTISIGIGINSGELMLGTIGAEGRLEGTVISDAVNLAARVESLTKEYNSALLISENTYRELTDPDQYNLQVLDQVEVKGKNEPITIWGIVPETECTACMGAQDLKLASAAINSAG